MKLRELKSLLDANREKQFLLQLPNQNLVPKSFHITEVGHIDKRFIDCGGTIHATQTCVLQAWVGKDADHRLNAGKVADVIKLAGSVVPNDEIDVEVEYEAQSLSQYSIVDHKVIDGAVILNLTAKHTDCLAKDKCDVPTAEADISYCKPGCC
jgi:hypothetical protein